MDICKNLSDFHDYFIITQPVRREKILQKLENKPQTVMAYTVGMQDKQQQEGNRNSNGIHQA